MLPTGANTPLPGEPLFRVLVEQGADIVTLLAGDGTVLYQSPSIARVLGLDPSVREGRSIFVAALVHPDDREYKRRFLTDALNQPGETVTAEFRLRHADGTYRHIEARGVNHLADPAVGGIVAVYRDVTERVRASRVQGVATALGAALTPGQVAAVILDRGLAALDALGGMVLAISDDGASLALLDSRALAPAIAERWQHLPFDAPFPAAAVARTCAPLWLGTRVSLYERFPALADLPLAGAALACVPLLVETRLVGVFSCTFPAERDFDTAERDAILALAALCAQALERSRLYLAERNARARAEEAVARTRALQAVTAALAGAATREAVAEAALRHGLAVTGAVAGALGVLIDGGRGIERLSMIGYPAAIEEATRRVTLGELGPIADAAHFGEPIWLESSAALFTRYPHLATISERRGYGATVAVPLTVEGQVIGVLSLRYAEDRPLDAAVRDLIVAIAGQAAQALERARLYQEARDEIVRRAAMEAELRAARDELDAILDGVADGVIVQAADGRFVYANAAAARLAGFTSAAEYLAADTVALSARLDLLDAEGQPFPLEQLPSRRALRGEDAPEMLIQFRRVDTGEIRWSLTQARAIRNATGETLAISVFQDVTARQSAERRWRFLAASGTRLPASLDEGETLAVVAEIAIETLADWAVVYILDEAGAVRRSALAHHEPTKAALAAELERRYPPAPDQHSLLWQALREGTPRLVPRIDADALTAAARDDDHARLLTALGPTSALCSPLIARGRTIGALLLFTTTSRRRLGTEDLLLAEEIGRRAALAVDNARLYAEAREALRARDQFLAIAAHELRTPVTSVKGYAQLLRRNIEQGGSSPERLERALATIEEQAGRLARLTGDLLDVARLRTGQVTLVQQPLELVALVRSVAGRFAEQLDARHQLVLTLTATPCPILGDADRLDQVLANLLENAAKYSPDGGAIAVMLCHDKDHACLAVRDSGIGLAPGAVETIFTPFGRAENALVRQIPGLGLGLHICRDLIARHQGRIWAESAGEGHGTTVVVELPLMPVAAAQQCH
jgi:PAS domain S-box-containing protein